MNWVDAPLRTLADVRRFEQEKPLVDRLPGPSVFDVFRASAEKFGDRIALTMLMTGAPDEQPRRVSYLDLFGLIQRAANLFSTLGGERPGVAYMLPSLIETHAVLWGAETAGYAVPINFLLNPEHIAELLEASDTRILVALGPHSQLDIWQKALKLREINPLLTLIRVASPEAPAEENVIDFATALMNQPADQLVFGEPRGGDSIAAFFPHRRNDRPAQTGETYPCRTVGSSTWRGGTCQLFGNGHCHGDAAAVSRCRNYLQRPGLFHGGRRAGGDLT